MQDGVRKTFCIIAFFSFAFALLAADGTYTLKEGETLFSVAKKSQVPVDVLSAFNGISDAAKVRTGTVIRLMTVYVVKKGDTLYSISRERALSLAKLLELNKLQQDSLIKVGDRLYLPVETVAETARPPVQTTTQSTENANTSATTAGSHGVSSTLTSPGDAVWPHGGRHEPYKGKLPGLVFFGAQGDVVRSATSGEVKWVAPYWGYGKAVIIKSASGIVCTYLGNEDVLVNVGDRVHPGTEIARLGESSQGGSARLYFSIKDSNGQIVDPEKFFSAKSQA
jgi:murein DD-endopeptidase MepM/ murein hydrolase activator NlpD